MEKTTTIRLNRNTHSELGELGKKGQTFDDIVRILIDFYKRGE